MKRSLFWNKKSSVLRGVYIVTVICSILWSQSECHGNNECQTINSSNFVIFLNEQCWFRSFPRFQAEVQNLDNGLFEFKFKIWNRKISKSQLLKWQLAKHQSCQPIRQKVKAGNPYWRERINTGGLLALKSSDQLLFNLKTYFSCLQNNLS